MALYEFEGKRPRIGKTSFVPETADVIGDVAIGEGCFIGVGVRVRGDYGSIRIGGSTSVQENAVIHARQGAVVRGAIGGEKIAVGIPARVVGEVTERHKAEWRPYKALYAELASSRCPKGFRRIDGPEEGGGAGR